MITTCVNYVIDEQKHENFRFTPWFRECRRLIDAEFFGRMYGVSFRLR